MASDPRNRSRQVAARRYRYLVSCGHGLERSHGGTTCPPDRTGHQSHSRCSACRSRSPTVRVSSLSGGWRMCQLSGCRRPCSKWSSEQPILWSKTVWQRSGWPSPRPWEERTYDVLICGYKQPSLAKELAHRLLRDLNVCLLTSAGPRNHFLCLARRRSCRGVPAIRRRRLLSASTGSNGPRCTGRLPGLRRESGLLPGRTNLLGACLERGCARTRNDGSTVGIHVHETTITASHRPGRFTPLAGSRKAGVSRHPQAAT